MSEQSPAVKSVSTKWTVTLSILGVAMLVLYRIAVHSKRRCGHRWFLKLVAVQIVIYLAAAWLSLRSRDSRALLVLGLIFAALFRLKHNFLATLFIRRHLSLRLGRPSPVSGYKFLIDIFGRPIPRSLSRREDLSKHQPARLCAHDVSSGRGRCLSFDNSC